MDTNIQILPLITHLVRQNINIFSGSDVYGVSLDMHLITTGDCIILIIHVLDGPLGRSSGNNKLAKSYLLTEPSVNFRVPITLTSLILVKLAALDAHESAVGPVKSTGLCWTALPLEITLNFESESNWGE